MNRVSTYSVNDKATVCTGKTCVTVYGEVAKTIQQIALFVAIVFAVATIVKALR